MDGRTTANQLRRNGSEVPCAFCGKAVYRTPFELARARNVFCNRICKDEAFRQSCVGQGNPRFGKRAGEERTCKACGATFYRYPSMLLEPGRTNEYCSNKCKGMGISAALKGRSKSAEHRANLSLSKMGKPNYKHRKPLTPITCLQCGETFRLKCPSQIALPRFCSTDCWYDYIRVHPEENPVYKGGDRLRYRGRNWGHQSKLARERDNHTCQRCDRHQFNPRLHVHHIRDIKLFGTDYEKANDLSNLITYCASCHPHVHQKSHA